MKYVTFDLEIAEEIPEGTDDWRALRPLGITCAATYTSEGRLHTWTSAMNQGQYAKQMNSAECRALTDHLINLHSQGYDIVTWNGLGFDFDVLADEVNDPHYRQLIIDLAMDHIDPGFTMLCEKGYMIGLNTACMGMNVEGKTEGMHGDLAPAMV